MRTKAMWTIGNKDKDKVYYTVYLKSDNKYIAVYDGKEGYIEPNKAVEIDIDLDEAQVGFAEGPHFLGIGSWIASPTPVKTDRSVTLTSDKRIIQPDQAEFTDPKFIADVNFFNEATVNNTARTLVSALLGKIPTVGGAVSGVLEFVWPEQKPDLIKESEERMKQWVRGQIDSYDTTTLRNTLDGLRRNLLKYSKTLDQGPRMASYVDTVNAFDRALPHFLKQPYTRGTIGLIGDIGALHIALLREQVVHTKEIYGNARVDLSDFKDTLKKTIKEYQDYIENVALKEELKWRDEQVEREPFKGRSGKAEAYFLRDKVTRQLHSFQYSGRNLRQGSPEVCVNYYLAQAKNSYELELRKNVVDASKLWSLFDPDEENTRPIPMDRVLWAGPLSGLSFMTGNEHDFTFGDVAEDAPGLIEEISVREYDRLDKLQFNYKGRKGNAVGKDGGEPHSIKVKDGTYLTRVETWWDFDLFGIKFGFSDGSSTNSLGNRKNGGKFHQVTSYPDHYVSAVKIGKRLHELYVGFTPMPNYYDIKKAK
ncbi:insecticidal delta-endotoxin Cry8Ea1 family protein [Verrucomicrobiota bacterium sgz303538]